MVFVQHSVNKLELENEACCTTLGRGNMEIAMVVHTDSTVQYSIEARKGVWRLSVLQRCSRAAGWIGLGLGSIRLDRQSASTFASCTSTDADIEGEAVCCLGRGWGSASGGWRVTHSDLLCLVGRCVYRSAWSGIVGCRSCRCWCRKVEYVGAAGGAVHELR